MNYEKKYKYALAKAKNELDACGSQDCDAARQIFRFFPELKESEDERIRKDMIDTIKQEAQDFPSSIIAEKSNSWISWLEKQGEQKSIDVRTTGYWHVEDIEQKLVWSEEDEARFESCIKILQTSDGYNTINANWLKSLKARYTWKPSGEQIMALRWVLNHIPYDSHKEEISGLLEQLKKLREE